ncbi:prolyl oligopeptidase family serine peptidase [Paenibacillus sp. MZ04-78.2]|uniref:alpha/beta hydrolase family protein n=1 Tax=Paenibacillus sp. MZ04-78.2 TaxID=2962034 RepID=UPI0020B64126|nr:prolyl oligopeptidase family serine peptidase [Paenibacillus sp. MZ04-78.2]MCP3775506.1 prolyl oligopeptidase family serine peptidase [Paenibacillus sp. MZ04-78.2]
MKKKIFISILILIFLVGGSGIYILAQHNYDMVEQDIEIQTPQGKLTGTFVLPQNYTGKLGLVLFIHGDGAINSTHDDGYKPLWEHLASIGYASLSLNKRGLNGSEGNWEHQTIDDRVVEARQAIAWAKQQPMIDENRIGAWGASQGGWVIPKLAKEEPIAFSMLLAPAINWVKQGLYHSRAEMEKQGYSEADIQAKTAYDLEVNKLLKQKAPYEEYLKVARKDRLMSEDRWIFAGKNFLSDATNDLPNFKTPVLLMLGAHDINVDYKDTEEVYRKIVKPELLTVKVFPDADHGAIHTDTINSELKSTLIFLFNPRQITVPAYHDSIDQFLKKIPQH